MLNKHVKLIAFEFAAKFSRRGGNHVQPHLCNAKNAIFKRLKTGFSLRSRSSPANSNAISFKHVPCPQRAEWTRTLCPSFDLMLSKTHMNMHACAQINTPKKHCNTYICTHKKTTHATIEFSMPKAHYNTHIYAHICIDRHPPPKKKKW